MVHRPEHRHWVLPDVGPQPGDRVKIAPGYERWRHTSQPVRRGIKDGALVVLLNFHPTSVGWCWSVLSDEGLHAVVPVEYIKQIERAV